MHCDDVWIFVQDEGNGTLQPVQSGEQYRRESRPRVASWVSACCLDGLFRFDRACSLGFLLHLKFAVFDEHAHLSRCGFHSREIFATSASGVRRCLRDRRSTSTVTQFSHAYWKGRDPLFGKPWPDAKSEWPIGASRPYVRQTNDPGWTWISRLFVWELMLPGRLLIDHKRNPQAPYYGRLWRSASLTTQTRDSVINLINCSPKGWCCKN